MPLAQSISGRFGALTGTISLLAFSASAPGQTDPAESPDDEAIQYVETLEEIIVYGDKSLHVLREETIAAEEAVFSIYNDINSNDDFDIHCYEEARTGTRIKSRTCVPNYVRGISQDPRHNAFIQAGRASGPWIPDWAGANKNFRALMLEMETLALEHPELLDALVEYAIKKETLSKAKACFGKDGDCDR